VDAEQIAAKSLVVLDPRRIARFSWASLATRVAAVQIRLGIWTLLPVGVNVRRPEAE
jgi:hypothetical protein